MKTGDLFLKHDFDQCQSRIQNLQHDTKAQWGKMNAAQMLAHCTEVQEVLNGKELKNIPISFKLFKGLIKKSVLSHKPYPKNARTSLQYVVSSEKDFNEEKERLLNVITEMHSETDSKSNAFRHSLFGKMTREERGWAAFKHLDHHLTQFGV